ncbi:MAG: HAMP domain-containing protein, partial [bacterium]|nr:HAMP domain-containing protein [bacterium]
RLILTDPVERQKQVHARKLIAGALSVFEAESKRILIMNEDWAMWDTMYNFVHQPNRAVLLDLSPRLMIKSADFSFIMLVNNKKEILFQAAYDNMRGEFISFDLPPREKGPVWKYLEQTFLEKTTTTGVINTSHGPLLVVSSPVLRSNDDGPPRGRLMMGRLIDRSFEKKITATIREKARLIMNPSPPVQPAPQNILEETPGFMLIRYPFKDVQNRHVFTIRLEAQKQIFRILDKANRLFFLLLIAGFILFGIIIYFIVHRLVVRRVKLISSDTDNIVSFDDLSLRVPVNYRDEITSLGCNINKMLQRLETVNIRREEIEHMMALNEKLIFLGKVTSKIAHEVNNPLFAIANSFAHIKKHLPGGDEQLNDVVRMLESEIKRVRNITRDMHQFTIRHIEKPSLSDLSTIINAAVKVVKWSKQLKHTKVNFKKKDHSFPLHCNPETLQQVFMNMIVNAVDAMEGGGKLVIDVDKCENNETYRVDFIDTGPGFSAEMKEKMFTPFTTSKSGKGSGQGLYVSDTIIKNHGGAITLDNDYKEGAHLVIHIPIHPPDTGN